jgi:hypothetical protein
MSDVHAPGGAKATTSKPCEGATGKIILASTQLSALSVF